MELLFMHSTSFRDTEHFHSQGSRMGLTTQLMYSLVTIRRHDFKCQPHMKVSLPDEELTRICGSTLAVELSLLKVDPIAEHVAETSKICQQEMTWTCATTYIQ